MPKLSNKGFGLLPILIISLSILLVLSFVGYSYYSNSLEFTEDVLQATSPTSSIRDINTFLFKNLFDSQNLGEFNRKNTSLIVSMSDNLDNCIFLPRGKKPIQAYYYSQQKKYNVRIYPSVEVQVLPKNKLDKKYTVVLKNSVAPVPYYSHVKKISHSCNGNIDILEIDFKRPQFNLDEELTLYNWVSVIDTSFEAPEPKSNSKNPRPCPIDGPCN